MLFIACTSDPQSCDGCVVVHSSLDAEHAGMRRIEAIGKSVTLGTSLESAPIKERTQMKVSFTYDFSISEHEVTCGEYASLMTPVGNCEHDSLPQTSGSYYDAVLYANARSKSEGLDTAYQYSRALFDSAGNCKLLENLFFDAEKESYRLPTEAEWVYAASAGWNPSKSWNATNSNFEAHKVCSKSKNSIGLCDMAGNVMELINDWLGYFKDTTVTNYAGATDGGVSEERIVKGGSFRSELSNVNLYSRGDVYALSSAKKENYIGFRLAFGSIPNAVWLDINGSAQSSRLQVVFSSSEMKGLLRTYKAKLAFRNDVSGNLAFVDYANWGSSVFEIDDTINVYHPEISPDGKWVAFGTRQEGLKGSSSLYVRPLSLDGETVKLDVESAAIPRWIVQDNDTLIVYVDDTDVNNDESSWKKTGTWSVSFKNGKFGKPKRILDGSFNGGVSNDFSFAASGASKLRVHREDGIDTLWYNGEQACNVSLNNQKQVLFLDFSSKTGIDFVGSKYRVHEVLLVADSTGRLINSVKSPKGRTFDNTEWVDPDFVIATLTNSDGAHGEIALVSLKDSSTHVLVKGDEIWHPSLWVDEVFMLDSSKSRLDPDSAGSYFVGGFSKEASIIRQKLELFWTKKDSINTVILGSSRPSAGADPLAFGKDIYAVNMTIIPNILYESRYELENYILPHAKNLKYVVVSLDIDLWYLSEREASNNFFEMEAPYLPGHAYDMNHDFWKDGYPEGMMEYVVNSYNDASDHVEYTYHRGMQIVPSNIGWEENPAVDYDSTWLDYRAEDYRLNLENLKTMIELAAEKDVKVLGVIFPQSPGFKKTGSFGRYGIRRSQADSLIQELSDLSKTYKNFKLLDENKMGNHDYPDSLAFNRDHLINDAGPMITTRIDSALHSFK